MLLADKHPKGLQNWSPAQLIYILHGRNGGQEQETSHNSCRQQGGSFVIQTQAHKNGWSLPSIVQNGVSAMAPLLT